MKLCNVLLLLFALVVQISYIENLFTLFVWIVPIIAYVIWWSNQQKKKDELEISEIFWGIENPEINFHSKSIEHEAYETYEVCFNTYDTFLRAQEEGILERYNAFIKKKEWGNVCSYGDLYVDIKYFCKEKPEELLVVDISRLIDNERYLNNNV